MEDDDPFGFVAKECQIPSSQEERLNICPFARESDHVIDDDQQPPWLLDLNQTPVEPCEIFMCSVPETLSDGSEEFQTPPEESLLANSEEQRPQQMEVDSLEGEKLDGGDVSDDGSAKAERTVNLVRVPITEVSVSKFTKSSKRLKTNERRKLDVEFPKDNVGETETNNDGTEVLDLELETVVEDVGLDDDKVVVEMPLRETDKNLGLDEDTVVVEMPLRETDKNLGLDEDTMVVEMPLRETDKNSGLNELNQTQNNGSHCSASHNIEDLDKFRNVSSGGANRRGEKGKAIGGGRELPASIVWGEASNAAEEQRMGNCEAKNDTLKNLLEALKVVAEKVDDAPEDADFLATARKRGVTFPRPRWWPPEGFD